MEPEESPEEGFLTLSQARESLFELGKSSNGRLTYMRMRLTDLGLTDVSVLTGGFGHLQSIDLSSNKLKTVDALNWMVSLREIILSDNQLESTDSIARQKHLQKVDLTRNFISSAGDWSLCPYLIELRLGSNMIRDLSDFVSGPLLEVLDLSDNQLTE